VVLCVCRLIPREELGRKQILKWGVTFFVEITKYPTLGTTQLGGTVDLPYRFSLFLILQD
jgi:hypothetical protein